MERLPMIDLRSYKIPIYKDNLILFNPSIIYYNNQYIISFRNRQNCYLWQNIIISQNFNSKLYLTKVNSLDDNFDVVLRESGESDTKISGYEDVRLVNWNDTLYGICIRPYLFDNRIVETLLEFDNDFNIVTESLIDIGTECEKNWQPINNKPFTFIYNRNPLRFIDTYGHIYEYGNDNTNYRGGSNVILYKDYYICVAHERDNLFNYTNVFLVYDNSFNLLKEIPFKFSNTFVNTCMGLCNDSQNIIVMVSINDCTAYYIKIPFREFDKILEGSFESLLKESNKTLEGSFESLLKESNKTLEGSFESLLKESNKTLESNFESKYDASQKLIKETAEKFYHNEQYFNALSWYSALQDIDNIYNCLNNLKISNLDYILMQS